MESLNPESLQPCPYDSSHMIRTKRMQMHIYECRKSHPTNDMEICPFNAAHMIPGPERRWHVLTCPDRHQVHGKIIQEMAGTMGCVETPAYAPVNVRGESWEAEKRSLQPGPQPVPKQAPPPVFLAPDEVIGLNPRERQRLYLQKKQAAKAGADDPQSFLPSQRDLPAQNESRGPSRSMALFQQHTQPVGRAPPPDIYQRALRVPPKTGSMGAGRGYGTTVEGQVPQAKSPGLLGMGQGQTVNTGRINQSAITPIGRGAGDSPPYLSSERNSGDAPFQAYGNGHDPLTSTTNMNSYGVNGAMNPPGRGQAMGMTRAEFPAGGRGAGLMPSGRGSPGMWHGGAAPPTLGGAWPTVGARGRGNEDGAAFAPSPAGVGIPFRGMTSQPEALAPSFGDMSVSGLAGRGRGLSTVYTEVPSEQRKEMTSESEDQEQFVDAVPWVGEGYNPVLASGERWPVTLASGSSLLPSPPPIGSWAMEMEREESFNVVKSSSDDLAGEPSEEPGAEAASQLRKLQKKLRQIADLEARKAGGHALNEDQEAKLKMKKEYESEVSDLQDVLNID